MNHSLIARMVNIALLSACSATALGDTMLLTDHNARMGPRHEALVACVAAAHESPTLNSGQVFSSRVDVADGATAGSKTYIMHGTAWDNGQRVAITARCISGNSGRIVATVARLLPGSQVATEGRR